MARGRPAGIPKVGASYRLTEEALRLLRLLAGRYGVTLGDMLEVMIRDRARQEGLWPPPSPQALTSSKP